ncbi:MAG: hypothetical protein HUU21_11880 [Polyangiaceae bacterium]|nr:hypothetical protein [Polyangiaceae bacterium]NUQ74247.1 hypothetical protein [Polyangiaceae bacterium]
MTSLKGSDDGNAAALHRRCAESYVEAWRQFGRMARGFIEESDGATRIATGMPGPDFNPMFVTAAPRDPKGVLEAARSFYGRHGMPWTLTIIDHGGFDKGPLERAAEASGLEQTASNPGMVLAPIPAKEKPLPEGLSISTVDTPEELVVYTTTMSEGFEMPPDVLAPMNQPNSLDVFDVTRYLGRAGGQPVATALRATAYRVGVIFNMVTLPAWRRRGFGEAITLAASRDGLAEGCVASFLQSTIMGYPLYLRAGYRHVMDFHIWSVKAS